MDEDPEKYTFTATVERGDENGAWLLLPIPSNLSNATSVGGRVWVTGTLNGFAIKSSNFPNGNTTRHLMFNKRLQAGAKAVAGCVVAVELQVLTQAP